MRQWELRCYTDRGKALAVQVPLDVNFRGPDPPEKRNELLKLRLFEAYQQLAFEVEREMQERS
jgi:hypothetical protein